MIALTDPTPDADVTVIEHPYVAFGASAQLFRCEAPEVLIVGAAGKTRAVLERINYLDEDGRAYPWDRVPARGAVHIKKIILAVRWALVPFVVYALGCVGWYALGFVLEPAACAR